MKQIITLFLVLSSFFVNAQFITSDKIFDILSSNDLPSIKTVLLNNGFEYKLEEKNGVQMNTFKKGNETLSITISNYVFTLTYITNSFENFNQIKSHFKTGDMQYKNSYKNNKYYTNSKMILGINEINKGLAFIIKIKHN